MSAKVRVATFADLDAIAGILASSFPQDFLISASGLKKPVRTIAARMLRLNPTTSFIASDGSNALGFVSLGKELGLADVLVTAAHHLIQDPIKTLHAIPKLAGSSQSLLLRRSYPRMGVNVNYICVAKETRGQGVGAHLLSSGLAELDDKEIVIAKTIDQENLVNFYQRLGFKVQNRLGNRIMMVRISQREKRS